jgi:hypothetical protein
MLKRMSQTTTRRATHASPVKDPPRDRVVYDDREGPPSSLSDQSGSGNMFVPGIETKTLRVVYTPEYKVGPSRYDEYDEVNDNGGGVTYGDKSVSAPIDRRASQGPGRYNYCAGSPEMPSAMWGSRDEKQVYEDLIDEARQELRATEARMEQLRLILASADNVNDDDDDLPLSERSRVMVNKNSNNKRVEIENVSDRLEQRNVVRTNRTTVPVNRFHAMFVQQGAGGDGSNRTESEHGVRRFAGTRVDDDARKTILAPRHGSETDSTYDMRRMLQADVLEVENKNKAREIRTKEKGEKRAAPPVAGPSKNISGLTDEEIVARMRGDDIEPVTARGIRIVENNPVNARSQTRVDIPRTNTRGAPYSAPIPTNTTPTSRSDQVGMNRAVRFNKNIPTPVVSATPLMRTFWDRDEPMRPEVTGSRGIVIDEYRGGVHQFKESNLNCIRTMVARQVGASLPVEIKQLKGVKVNPPDPPYKGEDDVDAFETYVRSLLRFFRLGRLVGPEFEDDRVSMLGETLSGRARTWFDREISNAWGDEDDPLGLSDVLCMMYKRFINIANVNAPIEAFKKARYSKRRGVLDFANELNHHAKRMIEQPSEYYVKKTFFNGLPHEMVKSLMTNKGISPELTPWSTIIDHAVQYESSLRFLNELTSSEPGATQGNGGVNELLRDRKDKRFRRDGERRAESPNALSVQPIEGNDTTYNTHRIREWIQENEKSRFGQRKSQARVSTSMKEGVERRTIDAEEILENYKIKDNGEISDESDNCFRNEDRVDESQSDSDKDIELVYKSKGESERDSADEGVYV